MGPERPADINADGLDAILVRDLYFTRIALEAARDADMPVVLLSPPEGARSMGVRYFRSMIDAAAEAVPGASFTDVLDCGHAPGLALGAFRCGQKAVTLDGSDSVIGKVTDIARQCDADLLPRTRFKRIIDPAEFRDPRAAVLTFLDGGCHPV